MTATRRPAAILAADVVGASRLMGEDGPRVEESTINITLRIFRIGAILPFPIIEREVQ